MQAARLLAIGEMAVQSVPEPQPKEDEVVIRVEAAGICGTDRHLFHGAFPSRPPVTLGHEFAGTVVAAGPRAGQRIGMRVACDPNIFCGRCGPCLRDKVNLCRNNIAIGLARDGGFADLACIPSHRALPLPEGLGVEAGAFAEPLACTLHGLDVARLIPGERALVLGGGVIGLLAVQLARAAGAEVMLMTRQATKREIAMGLGARHTAEEVRRIWPEGADAVIECAGVSQTMAEAPSLAAPGGRVVILGVLPQGERVAIEPFDLLFREVALLPAFINPFTQARAIDLLTQGMVQTAPLITRRLSLTDAPAAAPPLGDIKTLILP